MRGILGWGTYLPYRRLDRTTIAAVAGTGGGQGTRTVAGYDEDATTMAVEAARRTLRASGTPPRALWFATAAPAYLDRTNAAAVHAALRLGRDVPAYDALGSVRSGLGALRAALDAPEPVLVVTSDVRTGRPGSAEEAAAGDGAAALLVGTGDVLAEVVAHEAVTEEFLDRWRVPGDAASRRWEERFGETRYLPLAAEVVKLAVGDTPLDALVVAGLHERACAAAGKAAGAPLADRLTADVGNVGVAAPALLLAAALEQASPGQRIGLLTLADGAELLVLRTTDALGSYRPSVTVAAQRGAGATVPYGRFLAWRGMLDVEPPRRPEPARPSASAAARATDWKFGLASPAGVLADQRGTVTTFTVDRLAYSPSPPVVFAVVDLDGGERLPVELTDVDAADVHVGMSVEMTFRRLFTADGIANYFWKARPVRAGGEA